MKRIFCILALAALCLAVLSLPDFSGLARAKVSGSSGGSRSSFSSGSSSSGGSWSSSSGASTSKPFGSSGSGGSGGSSFSTSGSSGTTGATGGLTWSSSTGAAAKSPSAAGTPGSSFSSAGASGIRSPNSFTSYRDYTSKFGRSGNPVGAVGGPAVNPGRSWSSYSDYNAYRNNYYSGLGFYPPGYAYMSYPHFGLWDAMFLWMLLGHSGGQNFYYNNQNDPGVQAWRQEADRLAQSNAELKQQLADMDAKVSQLRKDGAPVTPGAIPAGLDPAMAYTADKVVKETPQEPARGSGFGLLAVIGVVGVVAGGLYILRKSKPI